MPFMIGPSPIRRTLKYLNSGKIVFRESVKIFSVNFNNFDKHHEGAREFVFWHFQQIQYKNPDVQCITLRNLTPSPFIRIFFSDGKSVLIDVDSRSKEDILDHLSNFTAICKTNEERHKDIQNSKKKLSTSSFGFGCQRHCICEVLGHVPCPNIICLPSAWRGIHNKNLEYKIPPCFMEPGLEEIKNDNE